VTVKHADHSSRACTFAHFRRRSSSGVGLALTLAAVLATVTACSTGSGVLRSLEARYPASSIEVQNQATKGEVLRRRKGVVLAVQADVPARTFRVLQAAPKGPRVHVRDYARVNIDRDRMSISVPGELTIPKGTELVVLDLTVATDRVHLFLHTAKPLQTLGWERVYGCTEIVLHVDPAVLDATDIGALQRLIERWLVPVASG